MLDVEKATKKMVQIKSEPHAHFVLAEEPSVQPGNALKNS